MSGVNREDSLPNLSYTPFPDLYPCRSKQERHNASRVWIQSLNVPDEILLIAWAILLSRYTQDESPIFSSNKEILQFEPKHCTLKRIPGSVSGERFTGVFFQDASANSESDAELDLLYDQTTGTGQLRSNGCVPPDHLEQLALQLRSVITEASKLKNWHGEKSIAESPALSILNPNPHHAEGPGLLHQLVKWHQPKQSLAIAFLDEHGSRKELTWDQLDKASAGLANEIRARLASLQRKTNGTPIVPVLIRQSPKLYVAQLAILKAGCAFCPLNLDAPEERIRFILQDVSATLIITTEVFRDKLRGIANADIINAKLDYEASTEDQDVAVAPEDTAYIMYTSGSTGTPKGVAVSHRAVTQALLAHDRHIPPFHRFLQFASPTFDVSVFEIFFPLFRGSTLVSCERSVMLNDLSGVINSMEVDAVELTPTVAASLLQERRKVPRLQLLLTIGEMLTKSVVEEFGQSSIRQGILYGMYGPTEAAIHCTLQSSFWTDHKVGIIGTPLATVSAFILGPSPVNEDVSHINVLPVGQIGELAVGGTQLADCYLNQPDQTSAAFLETEEYGRLYRTGDKARLLPDGSLECLGRIAAGQVKLRGQRVELGEIEEAVLRYRNCRAAVASVIHGIAVVFCILNENEENTEPIYQSCRKWLPTFMLPGDIVAVHEFPYLPSGKIDRKRLDEQYQARENEETDEPSLISKEEATTLSIARDVLGQQLATTSALAHYGLDSLRAIRFASLLQRSGFSMKATDILKYRSVNELASHLGDKDKSLNEARQDVKEQNLPDIWTENFHENRTMALHQSDLQRAVPCTPLQNAMLTETSRENAAYWNWVELELQSIPREQQIRSVFQTLTDHNEILRAGFCEADHRIYPFCMLIWKSMANSQLRFVDDFNYAHSEGPDSLLRALDIQVRFSSTSTRILLRIHHALYDGWSMDLITHDLDRLFHKEAILNRPQFTNVTNYHIGQAGSIDEDSDRLYWQEKLSGVSPCRLPNLCGSQPERRELQRLVQTSSVDLEELQNCARKINFSPQVYFQAAFAYLLAAYTGSSDIILGTVSSGRTLPVTDIEEIIGPCIATLPLRMDVGQSRTNLDLLRAMHRFNRELLDHCALPLREIRRCCDLQQGESLFDTLLVWQETLVGSTGSEMVRIIDSADYLEFNLLLEVQPCRDSLQMRATFQSSVIPQAQMDMLLTQIDNLVSWMLQHGDEDLRNAQPCFAPKQVSIENSVPLQVPFEGGVKALIHHQIHKRSDSPALAFASKMENDTISITSLTFAELHERAERLASCLVDKGIVRDTLVCICMEKSIEMYTCILATIYAGAGYLPLTPETPIARIKSILEEAEVPLCLSRGPLLEQLKSLCQCEIIDPDDLNYQSTRISIDDFGNSCEASDTAYTVFTSGSTGSPKGVLVTQQNLSSNIKVLAEMYAPEKDSRLLQACSQAFDVSVFEIFFAWSTGMCLCSSRNDILFQDIESVIRGFGITHLSLTPTVAALIKPSNVPTVRFLVTSGEAVTEHVFRTWAGHGLWQGYGPSETTNICTVNPRVSGNDRINNIGRPFANTSAFVVSEGPDFHPIPRGGVGELCFGGDQVFRGYLKMPELNSQKVIEHSHFGRIYRSGDLGRLLTDGSILFEGRIDDQIKLRGQRIELGEINASILGVHGIRDCFSMALKQSSSSSQRLVTFWVPDSPLPTEFAVLPPQEETRSAIDTTYESLRAKLPTYMVPVSLVPISRLPMTSQGKIDKRKLASAYNNLNTEALDAFGESSIHSEFDQNWTDEEKRLATIIAEVLNIASTEVGLHISFLSLGLDSISAIYVTRYIQKEFGLMLNVSIVLKNPTVSRLWKAMTDSTSKQSSITNEMQENSIHVFSQETLDDIKSTIKQKGGCVQKILPCTPLQEAMLSLGQDGTAYHNRTLFRISGDIARLRDSWQEMCRRHEILRTYFLTTNNTRYAYAQVVLSDTHLPWLNSHETINDPRAVPLETVQYLQENAGDLHLPYSLVHLKHQANNYLMLKMHHALYDALAVECLLYEVEMCYRNEALSPPISFKLFLDAMLSTNEDEADQFWRTHLKNYTPVEFPNLSGQSVAANESAYDTESRTLDIRLDELDRASKTISATMLSIIQTAFAKILSSFLGRLDLCFGNVVSGRNFPIDNLECLVAPCFNTLPVRVNLASHPTNIDLIQDLQQYNTDVLPFQLSSLRRIQTTTGYGGQRLFDTLLIFQQPTRDLDSDIWSIEKDYGVMEFPFVIEVIPNFHYNNLRITLHYQHSSIAPHGVRYVLEAFEGSLRSCIEYPSAAVNHLLSAKHLQLASATNKSIICSQNNELVPVFGIGDLYSENDQEDARRDDAISVHKYGKTFYGTGKVVRRLPDENHQEIVVKKDIPNTSSNLNRGSMHEDVDSHWTKIELSMRETIAQLANKPQQKIGKNTTIYQLGLDSINAVQLAAKLRGNGFSVSASDVMEHPTCCGLAEILQRGQPVESTVPAFDLEDFNARFKSVICKDYNLNEGEIHCVRPCTPLQSGLLVESTKSETGLYVNEIKLQLSGDIHMLDLKNAWRVVQEKYVMLRTGFAMTHHSELPTAMIEYRSSTSELPWQNFSDETEIQVTIERHVADILNTLHCFPWRLLLFSSASSLTLVLLAHHAIYDAQLLQNILEDVAKAYRGAELSIIPPLDVAVAEILAKSNYDTNESREFWERSAKQMAISRFPNMSPLVIRNGESFTEAKICSSSLTALEKGCREAGATIQAVAQVAWAQVLSSYIGEAAVTFGVVFSGRSTEATENAAFPCITTVPVPCMIGDDSKCLLNVMLKYNASVQRYQYTPLAKIHRWTGHPEEALFDTILTYQKRNTLPNSVVYPWTVRDEKASVNYALSIELEPSVLEDCLVIRVASNNSTLPIPQARLLLDQIENALLALLPGLGDKADGNVARCVQTLAITPAREHELSSDIHLVHEFVEHTACGNPDKAALEFATSLDETGHQQWNYRQIDEMGNRVAHLLQSRGLEPRELVATCFDKSPEASFAFIGILKAGCAFVALDPTAPAARKNFIIDDSRAKIILSTASLVGSFPNRSDIELIYLDSCGLESWPAATVKLSTEIRPDDLSYCLYTSGTTGTPKGCMLTHENVVQAMLSFQRLFAGHWSDDSRWLQFASFHFDVSVLEQFWSWSVGICVVSSPRDLIFQDIAEAIRRLRISHIDLTPSLARILHPDDVPSLCRGVFITGGEQLKQEIIDAWGPQGVIYNGYGPTEATIGVTMFPRVPPEGKPSNIGRQFDNVSTYVLLPHSDKAVLRGGIGELCVAGKLVGKGYLNNPQLTDERFPFLRKYGERVYRTGDLVRLLHDGTFIFLGRIDDQIKLRGQRLEVAEINNVIHQALPDLADITTLVLKHPKQQNDQLITFFTVANTTKQRETAVTVSRDQLMYVRRAREACHARLPTYMIPSYMIPISAIPLTVNNKVDGRKLQDLFGKLSLSDLQTLTQHELESTSPLTHTEKKVTTILAEFLSIPIQAISRTSSIFELGLDSISVLSLTRALKDSGFQNASVSVVMRNPRIQFLAKRLSYMTSSSRIGPITAAKQSIAACQHKHAVTASKALGVDQADIESLAPCTALQEGIISSSLTTDKPVYFTLFMFEIHNGVDISRLQSAWKKVFDMVQILHTRFIPTTDGYVQVVLRRLSFPWVEIMVENEKQVDEWISKRHAEWVEKNRDRFQEPFEVVLARCPTMAVLALHVFHALYDGNSIRLLLSAVARCYAGTEQVQLGPGYHEALSYGPLCTVDGAHDFWVERLNHTKPSLLRPLIEKPSESDCLVSMKIDCPRRFDAVRQSLGVTEQALFQACWSRVLLPYLGSQVIFGNVVSGRAIDFPNVEDVIGPLFNVIPFILSLEKDDTWRSAARKCHDFNMSVLPYQHTPLRDILKWCKNANGQPLFEVLFVFQKETSQTEAPGDLFSRQLEGQAHAEYPLALDIERKAGGQFSFTLAAQHRFADTNKCMQLLQTLENVLQRLIETPDDKISTHIDDLADTISTEALRGTLESSQSQINDVVDFEWTHEACLIRSEIANLAGIAEDQVDEHMSILELGLDSIDAIRLSSGLKKHGLSLSTSSIMESLTILTMVRHASMNATDQETNGSTNILKAVEFELIKCLFGTGTIPEAIDRILPVTPLQEAMLSEMVSSDFTHYFNHDILKIADDVNLSHLRSAWETAFSLIPVLRTHFIPITNPDIDVTFAQVVHKHSFFPWDETEDAEEESMAKLLEKITKDVQRTFTEKPPVRLTVTYCSEKAYLILSLSHAMYDGWSLQLLHETVHKLYKESVQLEQSEPCPTYLEDTLGISKGSANGQLQGIIRSLSEESEGFWRSQLTGCAPLALPCREKFLDRTSSAVHRREICSQITSEQISAFCRKQSITVQAFGATCHAFVLASMYHSLDVVFGLVLSGRDDPDTESAVFPAMNTVCARSVIHGTRQDMLQYMQKSISDMMTHQNFPLRKVQRFVRSHGKRLFDTLFICQRRYSSSAQDHVPLYESIGGKSDVEYPVSVEVEIVGGSLVWRTACHDTVLDAVSTENVLRDLDLVAKALLSDPAASALHFTEQGVSICTLGPFQPRASTNTPTNGIREELGPEGATWSATEVKVRNDLSTISKVSTEDITKDLSIFHLGLDSISAIKVSALLREHGVLIGVSDLLRAATITELATIAENQQSTESEMANHDGAVNIVPQDINFKDLLGSARINANYVEAVLPTTAGQDYMLSMWQNTRGVSFYPQFVWEIEKCNNLEHFHVAWSKLVAQTPILRTRFVATSHNQQPFVQVIIHKNNTDDLPFEILPGAQDHQVTPSVVQPLWHCSARVTTGKIVLKFRIHHALYDAVTLPVIRRNLENIMKETPQDIGSIQHLTNFLSLDLGHKAHLKQKSFWTKYLAEALPRRLPQPSALHSSRVELFMPSAIPTNHLDTLVRKNGVSLQALFFAIWSHVYASLLQESRASPAPNEYDVIFGVYLANRAHMPSLSDASFPTVNLVPLRVRSCSLDIIAVAKQIQNDLRSISTAENSAVRLWQVDQWTEGKVKLDCFVNFLTLPMDDERREEDGPTNNVGSIRVRELNDTTLSERKEIVPLPTNDFEVPEELEPNLVKESYLHSADIEVAVRNGVLDVGIFGPTEMLGGLNGAERLVNQLAHLFHDLQLD